MAAGGVWIPVGLLASSAQRLRNAMQRDLIGALGAAPQVIASALMLAAMRHELRRRPHRKAVASPSDTGAPARLDATAVMRPGRVRTPEINLPERSRSSGRPPFFLTGLSRIRPLPCCQANATQT